MFKYLIVLLDDTSVSFCHYKVNRKSRKLMPINILKKGLTYAWKENLDLQFVYPNYVIPEEYTELIESVAHTDIKPIDVGTNTDIIVINSYHNLFSEELPEKAVCVLRTTKFELFKNAEILEKLLEKIARLNIVITDIDQFVDDDYRLYNKVLDSFRKSLYKFYCSGRFPQLNILSDRIMSNGMNNCNAGFENITLVPDGNFYICPGFYQEGAKSIGNIDTGCNIPNKQLFNFKYAPICCHCDAYQCRRCVWLNQKMTHEVNTPSKEQCVLAHIERNASRVLLKELHKEGIFQQIEDIKELTYLDPFEKRNEWR